MIGTSVTRAGVPGEASPRRHGRGLPGAVALVVSLGFVMFLAMAATAAVAAPR